MLPRDCIIFQRIPVKYGNLVKVSMKIYYLWYTPSLVLIVQGLQAIASEL